MTSTSADQSVRPARWSVVDALALIALGAPWLAAALLPAVAQPQAYHAFADQRVLLGVPHALNVLSNLPFLAIGALGIGWLRRSRVERSVAIPYFVFFAGTLLTAFGSAWYHADPRDSTLVWDRLPIALGFAGLVAGTLGDRAPSRATALTIAFSAAAVAAVGTWALTGNLLPYMVMQASCVGASLYATAFVPSPFDRARWLYGATALYAGAVACERLDRVIEQLLGGALSGHTLKHLLASAALFVVYAMLKGRTRTAA
ncbi:MAG: ceramidase [Burkholderiaceae bacterium]|jgi:hypothetical protein|nr:ceramidase [Burkholderiaceae bacterium]MDH5208225.1 ceramidase [Burkholderiaceae bacterium]